MVEVAHGRAPAVATGIKRCRPHTLVFAYQGDGDLASIGMAEIIHAAARGEKISVFFVNNANYGMTGGQMAPTTLIGQKTTTTPFGRRAETEGYPIRIPELLASLDGVRYLERVAVTGPSGIRKTRRAIKNAFLVQTGGEGFALVEMLSPCPTCWRMSPLESLTWVDEHMVQEYPLGVIKNTSVALQRGED
jgi:2-oxoglutarate ferredoxin oxidoreductase subunit beta